MCSCSSASCGHSCGHSCRRALLPAGWLRRAPAPVPGGSPGQPGAAARALWLPPRPFISTAGERLSATLRRGQGGTVPCHRAALRGLAHMSPCPRASGTVPARGKAAFPRPRTGPGSLAREGSPLPLETGQENEQVDGAELRLGQRCKTSPTVPRELRGHSQGRAAPHAGAAPAAGAQHPPRFPSASSPACDSLTEENLSLPSPGLRVARQGVPQDGV